LSLAVALAAACGGGGSADTTPGPQPPDRLTVRLVGGGWSHFRVDLDCAIADRAACRRVLDAAGATGQGRDCPPAPGDESGAIFVEGTIDGHGVSAVFRRRTTCELRLYDRVIGALGL
jgi:hypothetical protein